jgi:hypothetical protein
MKKIRNTASGIEPTIFGLAAPCISQLSYRVFIEIAGTSRVNNLDFYLFGLQLQDDLRKCWFIYLGYLLHVTGLAMKEIMKELNGLIT